MKRKQRSDAAASGGTPSAAVPPHRRPGRPLRIATPQEFDRLVDEYVTECNASKAPVTLPGMTLYLGFRSHDALNEYGKRPEFSESVKRARLLLEAELAAKLDRGQCAGAIFSLKQQAFGWRDTQQVEWRGALATIDFSRLSDSQLLRIRAGEDPLVVARGQGSATPLPALKPEAMPMELADPDAPPTERHSE